MLKVSEFSSAKRGSRRLADRGRLVAELLSGSWQRSTPSFSTSDLTEIASVITACGGGGLAWRRIREAQDSVDPNVASLFQAQYRFNSLQAALHERNLKTVIALLRDAGIEPLLLKGWAIARLYPEAGMRPYVDLDLCVLPRDFARASGVLEQSNCDECRIDLHNGFEKFYESRTDDILAHSRLVKLDDLDVRVLNPEDDLRFLCLHMLRHGAVQPLWLCDIALLLESIPDDFDWGRCLTGSTRVADWVACAVGLAHQLLGVDVEGTPVARRARALPNWLLSTVLQEWGTPLKTLPQLVIFLRDPRRWLRELPKELPNHWPNPIEATMALRGAFSRTPRLPFQIAHLAARAGAMFSQLLAGFRHAVLG